MQLIKFVVIGALFGLLVGIIVVVLFPNSLMFGVEFNKSSYSQLGLPDYSLKSGSIFNSSMVIPILFGVIGGILGFITFNLLRLKQVPTPSTKHHI